jgi:hypothetical protein
MLGTASDVVIRFIKELGLSVVPCQEFYLHPSGYDLPRPEHPECRLVSCSRPGNHTEIILRRTAASYMRKSMYKSHDVMLGVC